MTRNQEIPTVLAPPSGDGHHRIRREMTPTELAEREGRQAAYNAMRAREDDFEKNLKKPGPKTERAIAGCVFAKSCQLPDGMINHESTVGFVPTTSLDDYGNFALLGGHEVGECGRIPLKKISGAPSFITGSLTLARAASIGATESAIVRAGSLVTAGVATGGLLGLVAMLAPSSLGDSASYTEEQLRSLNQARTRIRLRVEQQTDGTLKGYGYNTQSRRDWEFIPVITFKAQGSQQVADFGEGVTLIWTPAVEPTGRSGIPPLEGAPQAPQIWIFPPTPAADSIIVDPIYPPEYKDFILVFPADSGIKPLYIVLNLEFEAANYHGKADTPVKSKGPINGREALNDSVQVKPTSPRRIGIDPETKEFVVFDRTGGDVYHGHVRTWDKLHQDMKNALIKAQKVDNKGNIPGAKK
jgi:hypothetical protein